MTDSSDNISHRILSDLEEDILATYAEQIAELAQSAVEGGQDVDVALAALLAGAPDGVRTEAIQRFREMVEHLREEKGADLELTPEQEKMMEEHKAREKAMLAHLMSQETLEKIKRAMLSNPLFYEQVMSLGEKLAKRGIFLDTQKQSITSADVAAAVTPKIKQPDQDKGRG